MQEDPCMIVQALGVSVPVTGLDPDLLSTFPTTIKADWAPEPTEEPLNALARFTRSVLERTELLCVHAGVVCTPEGGAIAFPGRSGLGKSTLTAALVRAGFGYLSDEVLALAPDGRVCAFPRPIALDAAAVDLLGVADLLTVSGAVETLVPTAALGRVGPPLTWLTDLLLLERGPGPASLAPATRSQAVAALVANSFNHWRDPADSLTRMVRLTAGAKVRRVRYSDATELARVLAAERDPGM